MAKIQNVTLPYEALETIKKDVSDFSNAENKLTFNGILNTIISKYSGKSKADFSIVEKEQRDIISKALKDEDCEDSIKQKISESLIKAYKSAFYAKMDAAVHGVSIKFGINKDNCNDGEGYSILFNPAYDGYSTTSRYLSRLFESYAALKKSSREMIILSETFDLITNAIESKSILAITLEQGKRFLVKPYKIIEDPVTQNNYLISYGKPMQSNKKYAIFPYKISRICHAEIVSKGTGEIAKEEIKRIRIKLSGRSPSEISNTPQKITIWMSEQGEHKYNSIIHNRPVIKYTGEKQILNGINYKKYSCNCSLFQAKNYFLRLSNDAVITAPKMTFEEMKNTYIRAVSVYDSFSLNSE